ncbi:3-methyladenine DNA glycosylase AlkD [Arthrobacter sp. CAN_A214]|uniref:DNA alkylation repair protein n=1 Tax=Arthrobacter sp. CAN_A214 TaxID=2787720 RepID=UPI0018C9AF82
MSDPADFVDAALQREGSEERAAETEAELGNGLRSYGSSVGAVRGTVRDTLRRYPRLTHDEVTALSSELWAAPVFERRLAAVVLLQSNLRLLGNSDLTRIEGFVREARLQVLVDPLAVDVTGPLMERLDPPARARADVVLDRWAHDDDAWLRRAALLAPLRALRTGGGNWTAFTRSARAVLSRPVDREDDGGGVDRTAVSLVLTELERTRPELKLPLPDR